MNFTIREGEFVCLLGPSGCGKTTLLNLIAGFLFPTSGRLRFRGQPITRPGPDRAVVFQNGALLDWLTVKDNITFSQICRRMPQQARNVISRRMTALVGLSGFEDRYPYQLSGGMKQRVGVARALATEAQIILMDEPFSAVDVQTRESLQEELLRIHRKTRCTVVFVTHSIDEAVFLSDRIFLLSKPGEAPMEEFRIDLPAPRWDENNRLHPSFLAVREKIYLKMRRQHAGDRAVVPQGIGVGEAYAGS
ncbi:ABC transporter ATP-binding protein [Variovorax sp. PBL-E5]|uniref:ABC transporter ATP-binding protein n=1 Tax=Variovorax sp. PBL-E5 TaxID=434014 RepID=UPI0013A5381F|nr:ABC transporter ATP-binding protein [Variovorax sp. PBL-E5]